VPTSTGTGNYANFVQQGAGLTGFKSVGNNARQKEEVVTKFVNYLLKAKNQNRLAILAGYVPSTKDALEMFLHYKNGDFNNETGL
jgi:ABC-type glycerol-3-phosphate transport system substrate-binding protein